MADLNGRKYPVFKVPNPGSRLGGNEESNDAGTSVGKPRSVGRKHQPVKIRDLLPMLGGNEDSNNVGTSVGKPRSVGRKYQPVRISMMHFDDLPDSRNPGSSRKTNDLTMRKPIRNIHKLLESPKRTVRKRLDNLYDSFKSKENSNFTPAKAQPLSSKKVAAKTPAPAATLTSNLRSMKKTDSNKPNENLRRSRLLPPGTITSSYMNNRNSTARTSLFKPVGNPLPIQKNSHIKRPSDVPEETSECLEKSEDSNDPVTDGKKTDGNRDDKTSSVEEVSKETETPSRCCDCSRVLVASDASDTASKLPNESVNGLENAKDIAERDADAKEDEKFQRPTVIVMQKEATLPLKEAGLDGSLILPAHEGSFSEALCLRPSMNSTETDESRLFRNIETTCYQSESAVGTDREDEARAYICKLTSMNKKTLLMQQKHLTESIAQQEKITASLKLILESVNSQLDMQKTIRSNLKSKGWSDLSDAELSLIPRCKDAGLFESNAKKDCKSSSKENKEQGEENALSGAASRESKTPKSANEEPQLKNDDADSLKKKLSADQDETENIENETPTRRRSARLATKQARLSLLGDQNTPSKEEKKSKGSAEKFKLSTPSITTPARGGRWGRRSERPLREYMVLKSAIKCLNTPDSKRYRIGVDGKVQIRDSLSKTDPGIVLTDRLLMELHELYAATP